MKKKNWKICMKYFLVIAKTEDMQCTKVLGKVLRRLPWLRVSARENPVPRACWKVPRTSRCQYEFSLQPEVRRMMPLSCSIASVYWNISAPDDIDGNIFVFIIAASRTNKRTEIGSGWYYSYHNSDSF